MSAAHTTGALSTMESRIAPNDFTVYANGKWLWHIRHNGEQHMPVQRENMSRLEACWNACDSVSTEDLQIIVDGGENFTVIRDRLVAQRDALLQAMRLIEHATAPTPDDGGHHEAAHDLATSAIAAAEAA